MQDLLYILGPSYSGSTLLTLLLASHPDIATVGELKASSMGDISTYRCSCGDLLAECRFWKGVRERMRERGIAFDLADFGTNFGCGPANFRRLIRMGVKHPAFAQLSSLGLWLSPHYRRRRDQIVQRNRVLMEVITELQGARVFLDGSKDPERLNEFVNTRYWNVKVVHLVRDGRGVASSLMKHGNIPMQLAASEWLERGLTCDRVLSRIASSDVLSIKYEDLCEDPENVVERVLKCVRLRNVPRLHRKSAADLHILGNDRVRLDPSKTVAKDERWKRELNSVDIEVFEQVAGSRNTEMGYSKIV